MGVPIVRIIVYSGSILGPLTSTSGKANGHGSHKRTIVEALPHVRPHWTLTDEGARNPNELGAPAHLY